MNVSVFTYKGIDIDLTNRNGFIAYTFQFKGEPYGFKIPLESRKSADIVNTSASLLLNAVETINKLFDDESNT